MTASTGEPAEFWLYGYGYAPQRCRIVPRPNRPVQEPDMETPASLWYLLGPQPQMILPRARAWTDTPASAAALDRRVPGWVTGYVRRFWQVCNRSLVPT